MQKGDFGARQAPFYGDVLVLKADTQHLQPMPSSSGAGSIVYQEHYDLTQGAGNPVNYQLAVHYHGQAAEAMRQQLTAGKDVIKRQLAHAVTAKYPTNNATNLAPASLKLQDANTGLTLGLELQLANPWEQDAKQDQRFFVFEHQLTDNLANDAVNGLQQPFPMTVDGTVTLRLDASEPWAFTAEQHHERNPWFEFNYQVQFEPSQHQLTLRYQYQTLQRHIDVSDVAAYRAAIRTIDGWRSYGIVSYHRVESSLSLVAWSGLGLLALCLTAVIGWLWYRNASKRRVPSASHY